RASRSHDELMVHCRAGQESSDQPAHVGQNADPRDLEAGCLEQPLDCGAALVGRLTGRGAVAARNDDGLHSWRQSPDLPPVLDSSRILSMEPPLSTPLTMSMSVRPATAAAVSASISTPVWPVTRAAVSMRTPSSRTSNSTSTEVIGSGWQRGIS